MYKRLIRIDPLIHLPEHYYLNKDDDCLFLGEYTSQGGHGHSETNKLIYNLKKYPYKKDTAEWRYKQQAIEKIACCFYNLLKGDILNCCTFIPVPPSKVKEDPAYDNRLLQILYKIQDHAGKLIDIRELVVQKNSTSPSHEQKNTPRKSPQEHIKNYIINEELINPKPNIIFVFDDMLTTGSHFKAIQKMIHSRYAQDKIFIPIKGLFISRRSLKSDDSLLDSDN